jgi:two-component system, chemotaxis family, protein-glutamate methylesterase/glutaminase
MNGGSGMPIRVLIVDDSALIRQLLTAILGGDKEIEVVGVAPDPIAARDKIKALNPDVLTLDIEMPRMDGLSFLEKLMALRPMPVVVVSTLTQKGADAALRALELGAIDYVAKPLSDIREGVSALGGELITKVKAAAVARISARSRGQVARKPHVFDHRLSTEGRLVAVGASTGGVEALQELFTALPANIPATLVTQHMPAGFTACFAKRLDERCAMTVTEAANGVRVLPGHVYIAPGNRHLELVRSGAHYFCHLHDGPPVSGHRPSVDVLFNSFAAVAGKNAIGVILTGMGSDGAAGLLKMRQAGARTMGQDEASCLIYGMPKAAKRFGGVEAEFPLAKLPQEILACASSPPAKSEAAR